MTTPVPAMARQAGTRRMPRAGLGGGALSVRAWLLLAAGPAGGLVFTGVGLLMDGPFAQDPTGGYPPGARAGVPTAHGQVHTLFAMITITALAGGCFVLAARFAAEPRWRRWAVLAAAAGEGA